MDKGLALVARQQYVGRKVAGTACRRIGRRVGVPLEERSGWRKVGFVAAVVFTVLFVFAVVFAAVEKRELTQASEAIVMVQAASVKSAPEKEGSDIFILHEGTKVEVLSSYDGWTEIMIADGNKGWVPADSVELITY